MKQGERQLHLLRRIGCVKWQKNFNAKNHILTNSLWITILNVMVTDGYFLLVANGLLVSKGGGLRQPWTI
jgi:hypothetical protein